MDWMEMEDVVRTFNVLFSFLYNNNRRFIVNIMPGFL